MKTKDDINKEQHVIHVEATQKAKVRKAAKKAVEEAIQEVNKAPENLDQMFKNPHFQSILSQRISDMRKYTDRGKYKSNPISVLDKMGMLKLDVFIEKYIEIINKTCTLATRERDFIKNTVVQAAIDTLVRYQKVKGDC